MQSQPAQQAERIVALDVLRGFALLGILAMNVQSFAMPGAAYFNPTAYGGLTAANRIVYCCTELLADQKFMTIFSILFGAGIVLMTSRQEAAGVGSAGLHYRRMGVLILFGLLHAYLIWFGDILFTYGVCGLLAYLFRKLSPRWLLVLALVAIAIPSIIYLSFDALLRMAPPEEMEKFERESWQPSPEKIERELATYRGDWLSQMPRRAGDALMLETFVLAIYTGWRAGGLMLLGMALYQLGVVTAQRSNRYYACLAVAGVCLGSMLTGYGIWWNFSTGWGPRSMFVGSQFNYWGSLLTSLGYIGIVMLACRRWAAAWVMRPLAAVGQMALTNYLMQSVLGTLIFYGHGLGYFGHVDRLGQQGIVAGIWLVQLMLSPVWLTHFRFGPAEWLWRTLSYGRVQPMLRVEGAAEAG